MQIMPWVHWRWPLSHLKVDIEKLKVAESSVKGSDGDYRWNECGDQLGDRRLLPPYKGYLGNGWIQQRSDMQWAPDLVDDLVFWVLLSSTLVVNTCLSSLFRPTQTRPPLLPSSSCGCKRNDEQLKIILFKGAAGQKGMERISSHVDPPNQGPG